jgi:hypothetical protein
LCLGCLVSRALLRLCFGYLVRLKQYDRLKP